MIVRGLYILILALFVAWPTVMLADSETHEFIEELQEQGFTNFVIEKTFLGRIRIIATDGRRRRELIIHPFSKEIMRDRRSRDDDRDDDDRDDDRGDESSMERGSNDRGEHRSDDD